MTKKLREDELDKVSGGVVKGGDSPIELQSNVGASGGTQKPMDPKNQG